ncbi:tRNA N(3)-methylcytidine methyltransferase METTL6 [Ischnura elegans]|uniref:tRNA N(3)-methylcytidine methyltransferase METTL6 n=1 Tax=Ischnura elegans TaxID=197161 RepID=UPI001ED87126|nr:tRNA N(3)-methylcytidine methyltransferase METTL6 [Ischnura elegans]XP_046404470.1 tRNA N(3)-methylcytidine methyltransferase METTL6 [Ischnura elegans]XP_046404471.1 tRNA N(3)-methylcytidine methyltransferase METTL6 [Ischnura elegans]XP_046404472.1 tRNA N(3)-methylcytidine methyltransferase METTL6 [Ischnura elegans]XP_046404473.1 tRNA N(3)-methylcytidine methyltransferase METTL6 [Ischnura elegans]XP_046404474.1 tRNA N(3)-methylcytidine methyltransferase METTL6 [Ischnura elegans]XP_04640447
MTHEEAMCARGRVLTEEEENVLARQNTLLVSNFKAEKLEQEAKRNWDLFYKRNSANFFKDRHWTTREFQELVKGGDTGTRRLLEIGCGVGNFIFPLLEDGGDFFVYACDISPRAIDFVKKNDKYDGNNMLAFQADATTSDISDVVESDTLDIVTLIFVLSSIHPEKHTLVMRNALKVLKPGGILLFRDYGLHDMAQLRFKPGQKIAENFYVRQDGTRAYYFSSVYLAHLAREVGFDIISCDYIHRRTSNVKEGIDVPRIFLQAKLSRSRS